MNFFKVAMSFFGPKTSSLVDVAREGDVQALIKLYKDGVDVDIPNSAGSSTALMTAANWGNSDCVEFLLSKGAKIDMQDKDGRTPLIFAVTMTQIECVNMLVKHGADPNRCSKDGWSPLYIACNKGSTEIVEMLVSFPYETRLGVNINFNIPNSVGGTPLMVASMHGHKEIVNILMRQRADVNLRDLNRWNAVMKAADKGNTEVVSILIEHGADVTASDNNGFSSLALAAKAGKEATVRALLDSARARPDINFPDAKGRTALFYAAQNGHLEAVRELWSRGADVTIRDKDGNTALSVAKLPAVRDLLQTPAPELPAPAEPVSPTAPTAALAPIPFPMEALPELHPAPPPEPVALPEGTGGDVAGAHTHPLLQTEVRHPQASFDLGYRCLIGGGGAEVNLTEAAAFFTEAANQGHGAALCNLGMMCHHGIGVEVDEERALAFFQRSAAASDPAGLYNLAVCHQDGVATPKDIARALELFHEAALLGNAEAQSVVELAGDAAAAVRFLLQAAERGEMVESYRILPRPISLQLVRPAAPVANAVGAGPDAPRVQTNELMSSAASGHEAELSQLLVAGGHAVNCQCMVGMTALSHAAKNGHHGCVTILLHHGADPNLLTANRWSPLHYAANREDVNIMTTLLQMGALRDAQNSAGSTPLMTSCKLGHIEGIQLLLCMGADPSITNESGMSTLDVALSHNQVQAAAALLRHPNVVATYF